MRETGVFPATGVLGEGATIGVPEADADADDAADAEEKEDADCITTRLGSKGRSRTTGQWVTLKVPSIMAEHMDSDDTGAPRIAADGVG